MSQFSVINASRLTCRLIFWTAGCSIVNGHGFFGHEGFASDAIRPIRDLTVKDLVFDKPHLNPPILIHSNKDAQRYFVAKSATLISQNIDFENHAVVLFAWQGSGQDRLEYKVQESYPETLQFSYLPGRTKDLRQHFLAYAVRSDVVLRLNDQAIALKPFGDDRKIASATDIKNSSPRDSEEWGQWMGPQREGVYRESGVIDSIPETGLPIKWRTSIAGGYAGPAVAGGRVFVFDYLKRAGEIVNDPGRRVELQGEERLLALDAHTGTVIWTHRYERPYSISYPAGPRCTPTVDDDRVYILGSEGDLKCLQADTGSLVWEINLPQQFQCEVPRWGFSSHPLIDGDLVYSMVGGAGQGIVAFDKLTGEVRWKAIDTEAGYCPPTIYEHPTDRQLVVFHPRGVTSLNPANGDEYWAIPLEPSHEMSIARPMIDGNKMYASGLGSQSVMIELDLDQPTARELWRGNPKNSIFSGNATPLFVDGILYGSDSQLGNFMAVDSGDGQRLWTTFEATRPDEKRRISHGTGFVTRLGDSNRYLILNEVGELMVAQLTADEFQSLGRFFVLEPTGEAFGRDVLWSHPAYALKTAFIRNDKEIIAVDLAIEKNK